MKKEYLYGIIGLLAGVLIAVVFASNAVNSGNNRMMGMMGIRAQAPSFQIGQERQGRMGMSSSMEDMMESVEDESGDSFDEAFIDTMIVHHQGAINMAKLAKENAMHNEIKEMADDIISAQSKEIEMMKDWRTQWRY